MNTTFNYFGLIFIVAILLCGCSNSDNRNNSISIISQPTIKADTLVYEITTYSKTIGECGSGSGCMSLHLSFPLWKFIPNNFNDKQLLKWSDERMLSFWQADTLFNDYEQLINTVIYEYNKLNKDTVNVADWQLKRDLSVISNDKQFLNLCFSETSFAGGAHPNSFKFYKSFNATTGQAYRLNDIFKPMYEESLTRITEEVFRMKKKLQPGEDLELSGYWFDNGQFKLPTKNFCCTDEGLLFHYNSYEIAPYSEGSTTIIIPWNKLDNILKSNFQFI